MLWLAANGILTAVMPGQFNEDGSTGSVGVLLLILASSVVCSVASGYLTAVISKTSAMRHATILGIVLLAVGIMVQLQWWDKLPLWYHLSFMVLLLPATVYGARLRATRPAGLTPAVA
jgi:hypothetical protein